MVYEIWQKFFIHVLKVNKTKLYTGQRYTGFQQWRMANF